MRCFVLNMSSSCCLPPRHSFVSLNVQSHSKLYDCIIVNDNVGERCLCIVPQVSCQYVPTYVHQPKTLPPLPVLCKSIKNKECFQNRRKNKTVISGMLR